MPAPQRVTTCASSSCAPSWWWWSSSTWRAPRALLGGLRRASTGGLARICVTSECLTVYIDDHIRVLDSLCIALYTVRVFGTRRARKEASGGFSDNTAPVGPHISEPQNLFEQHGLSGFPTRCLSRIADGHRLFEEWCSVFTTKLLHCNTLPFALPFQSTTKTGQIKTF